MSEPMFFNYNGDAITRAATGAAATADELAALIGTCGGGLATATGSLETVAALRQCAGTWTDRIGALGEDVRLVSQRLTDSLTDYLRIDDDVAAVLDGIAIC
jgi:hypothetical protein